MSTIMQVNESELRGNRLNKPLRGSGEIQLIDFHETHQEDKPKHYQIILFGIDEQSNSYSIYIRKGDEVMPWKKFNSNMAISVEYDLEY